MKRRTFFGTLLAAPVAMFMAKKASPSVFSDVVVKESCSPLDAYYDPKSSDVDQSIVRFTISKTNWFRHMDISANEYFKAVDGIGYYYGRPMRVIEATANGNWLTITGRLL
jgi:hypothetical protein